MQADAADQADEASQDGIEKSRLNQRGRRTLAQRGRFFFSVIARLQKTGDAGRVRVPWIRVAFFCAGLSTGCSEPPPLESQNMSTVIANTEGTKLGTRIFPLLAAQPGKSGIYPLTDAHDAFAARVHLARAAERTLDVQYFIWRNDMTGTLLFEALRRAADRGVRVRLLLDDFSTSGLDPLLAALDAHGNIEVRLFNPFGSRSLLRWAGYLTDFSRLNRRMHNKSFTADNQATIIGGRNVGDEYFGAGDGILFTDLDVMAIGPVVNAVSNAFDRYWNSDSSYPVHALLAPVDDTQLRHLRAKALVMEQAPAAQTYIGAIRDSPFVREMLDSTLPWEWAPTRMLSDDPAKVLGKGVRDDMLFDKLRQAIGEPSYRVNLISPYFVPTAAGVASFASMAGRGVKIKVLTNALEATNEFAVHAGYAKRRKALLEAGIILYEQKRQAQPPTAKKETRLPGSSSGSSLHAKTFSFDRSRVFIGSFNFDPRSARLNTELGFIIESPALAKRIDAAFDRSIPSNAYEARLTDDGRVYWIERRDGGALRYDTEPNTSFWRRASVVFLSLLPIEGLL
jgi:cardiolipin synthase C